MTKASDNEYPSVLLAEQGSDITTPGTGFWRLYAKATGLFHRDDAGAVTGPILDETSHDALDHTGLTGVGGGSGISSGTSNPGSPTAGDLFWRTDLGLMIYYDGTRWLTTTEYRMTPVTRDAVAGGYTSSKTMANMAVDPTFDTYVTTILCRGLIIGGTALSASHKWEVVLYKSPTALSYTAVTTMTFDSGTLSTVLNRDATVNTAMTVASAAMCYLAADKTGTPGTFYPHVEVRYRLIVT